MSNFPKLPYFLLFSVIALNVTAFTLVLQTGVLIINSLLAKVIAWGFTLCAWFLVYLFRNR